MKSHTKLLVLTLITDQFSKFRKSLKLERELYKSVWHILINLANLSSKYTMYRTFASKCL